MRRLMLLMVVLMLPLGCKKKFTDKEVGPEENPKVIPSGKGDLSVRQGDGIQAPRKAAARIANDHNLNQLYQMIFAAQQADPDERVPSAEQIMQEVRQAGPVVAMIRDEIVILTNTTNKEGIWAYTKWPQRNGNHYVITKQGRTEASPMQLSQALQAQGTMPKLEK